MDCASRGHAFAEPHINYDETPALRARPSPSPARQGPERAFHAASSLPLLSDGADRATHRPPRRGSPSDQSSAPPAREGRRVECPRGKRLEVARETLAGFVDRAWRRESGTAAHHPDAQRREAHWTRFVAGPKEVLVDRFPTPHLLRPWH